MTPIKTWAYNQSEDFACRVEINSAGIAVYAGEKGGKELLNSTWDRFVADLKKDQH